MRLRKSRKTPSNRQALRRLMSRKMPTPKVVSEVVLVASVEALAAFRTEMVDLVLDLLPAIHQVVVVVAVIALLWEQVPV
jgi:hypothetical protein